MRERAKKGSLFLILVAQNACVFDLRAIFMTSNHHMPSSHSDHDMTSNHGTSSSHGMPSNHDTSSNRPLDRIQSHWSCI